MPGRVSCLILLLIAGGLAGCGATATSTGNYHGEQARVAAAVDALTNAASSHDASRICTRILAPAVSAKAQAAGGRCASAVSKALDTVDTFRLTVQSVTINGSAAQVRVKSTRNGKDHADTLGLVRLPSDGSWRVASLSP